VLQTTTGLRPIVSDHNRSAKKKHPMKIAAIVIALFTTVCFACAGEKSAQAFVDFRPKLAVPFGIVEAQALADAKRAAVYGVCGMSIFKEKKGPVWIFETKVGYGGSPGPDISVVESPVPLPSFGPTKEGPNSERSASQQPTPDAG
jgi:hypothetical protein